MRRQLVNSRGMRSHDRLKYMVAFKRNLLAKSLLCVFGATNAEGFSCLVGHRGIPSRAANISKEP